MSRRLHAGVARLGNKRLIQRYLDMAEMTQTEFARSLGISQQAVGVVINGHGHSRRVLDGLRKLGVPEELLCDPRRKEARAGAGT